MNKSAISELRLINQHIAASKFKTAKEIVSWMGAMQAQDYAMAKWAVGLRLPGSTEVMIEAALDKGDIIRTHLLRPTWHFVSADDIHWLLELTAPGIKVSMKSRHKAMELTTAIFAKSCSVMEKALSGGNFLTREELVEVLGRAKINTENSRASHIFFMAELDGIICSGPIKGNRLTYALLAERVPKGNKICRDEALAKLAEKYFSSHGPAALDDFIWWSGLRVAEAKSALEMIKPGIISEKIGRRTYWVDETIPSSHHEKNTVYMLPAYDEFIISYKDRSASLPSRDQKKAVSSNGIFRPVILINGQAEGIWKRAVKKEKVVMEADYFLSPDKTVKDLVDKASLYFGRFINKKVETTHTVK